MILSRLNITGPIDFNTPRIVLNEIAETLFIKENNPHRLILKIGKFFNRNKISENYENDQESLRVIARYVNRNNTNWRKSVLLKAFRFLCSFERDRGEINEKETIDRTKIDINFFYGEQTSENPESLNACVLYSLCRKYNIITDYHTSIDDMAKNIKFYLSERTGPSNFGNLTNLTNLTETSLKIRIFNYLKFEATKSDLINITNLLCIKDKLEERENIKDEESKDEETKDEEIKQESKNEEIKESEDKLKDENTDEEKYYAHDEYKECADRILMMNDEKIKPKTHLEAIVMGAIYFKIDLSECKNPILEYESLLINPYFPSDKKLKERMKETHEHPDSLQNPYLNKIFNLNFPSNMYNMNDLICLCAHEALNIYDYSYYSSLQLFYLTETFIHGKQGNIINKTTTFLENIQDLKYDEVVIYGNRSERVFRAYTYGELRDTFSSYKRFSDPITNEIFSNEVIEKLSLLTQKEKRLSESEDIYRERLDLGEEIDRVKLYISSKNEYLENFLNIYENLDEEVKNKVEKSLNDLLHLAMYMRNWDGVGDYPLKSEDTTFSSENQIIVDDRVTQALIVFEKGIEELGSLSYSNKSESLNIKQNAELNDSREINESKLNESELNDLGNLILNLPLMTYHRESNTIITNNDPTEGLTIKERIQIVKGGEEQSMSSCIRMSSNKFCATSFFYMVMMGFRMPFNISEVSHIV